VLASIWRSLGAANALLIRDASEDQGVLRAAVYAWYNEDERAG
jgi:hypothetical protein